MCERSKIHVFLGAPPASGTTGAEEGQEPPADWRHLELTWQDGHLLPVTGETSKNHRTGTISRFYLIMNHFSVTEPQHAASR